MPKRNVQVDDVVLLKDDDLPRNEWPLARVLEVFKGSDGYVRTVRIALSSSVDENGRRKGAMTILNRPIHKVIVLVESCHEGP